MIKEFVLTDKEYADACNFEHGHQHKEVNKGAIGGGLTISFHPNGIGHGVTIKCDICGESKDITEYDSW